VPDKLPAKVVRVSSNERVVESTHAIVDRKLTITLAADKSLSVGDSLQISIH